MDFVQDLTQWVGHGKFSAAPGHFLDLEDLLVLNSSTKDSNSYAGLSSNSSYWADGKSVLTRKAISNKEQFQMPLAAVQVEARGSIAYYNGSTILSNYSIGSEAELMFDFADELACKQSCNTTLQGQVARCFNNSTNLFMSSTDTAFYGTDGCFTGQTLACGTIVENPAPDLGSSANIQFAVHTYADRTIVRTCEVSVSYVKPLVNN